MNFMTKINVWKKEFIWLTCPDQSLLFRGFRAGTEAENLEQSWLLAYSLWLGQFTYITQDQRGRYGVTYVSWDLLHHLSRKWIL